ncbi:MAG: hypothetical protein U9O18_00185 [Chloroflexota bacterium]|nr:hypothetical protein [Chloroflexota bacterium]
MRPARFLWAAIGSAVVFAAVYATLILTPLGQELENFALMGARQEFAELRESSLAELSEISMMGFAVAIGLVMLVALLRRKPLLAFTTAAIMVVSVVIAEIAKQILIRPELIDAPPRWLNNSFPSGHVTIAVAIGIGAVIVVPYALRPVATLVGAVYAMSIGQAVEVAGWHRLSGAIGATFLVLAVASFGLYLLARSGRVQPFTEPRRFGALIVTVLLGGLAAVVGGVGLFFGIGRLLPIPVSPTESDLLLAYTATLLIGTAVIALAFLAFLWLIRPYRIGER